MSISWMRIPLTQGRSAVVDTADFELVSQYKWFFAKSGYAQRSIYMGRKDGRTIYPITMQMHKFLIDPANQTEVDHANRDGLDNRRDNLRPTDRSGNMRNRGPMNRRKNPELAGVKGVSKSRFGTFVAAIYRDGKNRNLGTYKTPQEAALAYNKAAKELHGDYAQLNVIKENTL